MEEYVWSNYKKIRVHLQDKSYRHFLLINRMMFTFQIDINSFWSVCVVSLTKSTSSHFTSTLALISGIIFLILYSIYPSNGRRITQPPYWLTIPELVVALAEVSLVWKKYVQTLAMIYINLWCPLLLIIFEDQSNFIVRSGIYPESSFTKKVCATLTIDVKRRNCTIVLYCIEWFD